ncbi:carbohydrate ABC transporter permease [Leadbettera azotonutricia]|uniref:ABC transporter, permease protein n=1 Tax=Leadbettera azotonutricia (strain ATCC BAA-888 / DSM 13862 / ZAS-9) TaxID=545695 RepID=F5YDX8_LEAAZ|nr:carbohydrate ABC transporter permease [Leadbettera azotonutricia]AEF82912.1 ABC transporter, permease protein [Leadbettera azotonutricia ZAS-9]
MNKDVQERLRIGIKSDPIGFLFIHGTLLIAIILTAYPLFYVLLLAVMPYKNFVQTTIHFLPNGFTTIYFKQIFSDANLPSGFIVSIFRTAVGTILSVVFTMMAAYALSSKRLRLSRALSIFFLIPMFFSAGIIPFYLTVNAFKLTNTFWSMIFPNICMPMWFFVARANLSSYPQEILEAAHIDGAGQLRIFWRIVWPTNTPIIATIAMMYGVFHWNEYFYTRILVHKNLWTAPVHLYNLIQQQRLLSSLGIGAVMTEPLCYQAAVSACLILPILIVYPFLQRFIVSGLTAGSVKG